MCSVLCAAAVLLAADDVMSTKFRSDRHCWHYSIRLSAHIDSSKEAHLNSTTVLHARFAVSSEHACLAYQR
jgi:hypothetical protein